VEISLTGNSLNNHRYSISKATLNSVKANQISAMVTANSKCLYSNITSSGSSAKVKYSYNTYYYSWEPKEPGQEFDESNLNYESTETFEVNIKIDSDSGELTANYSKVK
jgi:hypothetical protein